MSIAFYVIGVIAAIFGVIWLRGLIQSWHDKGVKLSDGISKKEVDIIVDDISDEFSKIRAVLAEVGEHISIDEVVSVIRLLAEQGKKKKSEELKRSTLDAVAKINAEAAVIK